MILKYILTRFIALLFLSFSFTFILAERSPVQADASIATATPTGSTVNRLPGTENSNGPKKAQAGRLTPLLEATSAAPHVAPNRPAELLTPSVKGVQAAANGETCYEYFGNNGFETYDDWLRYDVDADNVLYSTDYRSWGTNRSFLTTKTKMRVHMSIYGSRLRKYPPTPHRSILSLIAISAMTILTMAMNGFILRFGMRTVIR